MSTMVKDVEAYKTIKVPLWVYENAKEVELALIKQGIAKLPAKVLDPERCPICKSAMAPFRSGRRENRYLRCSHCGYTQQLFRASDAPTEGIALGTAIGMGLIFFLNSFFAEDRSLADGS